MKCSRLTALLTTLAVLVSLTACSRDDSSASSGVMPNATYSGTIRAITDHSVTLSVENGEVTIELTASTVFQRDFGMDEMPGGMGGMPGGTGEIPGGMGGMPGGMGDMPSGTGGMPGGTGDMPGGTGGMPGDGVNPPEKPDGVPGQPLTWSELVIGDRVTVVTNSEGTAATVTATGSGVLSTEVS